MEDLSQKLKPHSFLDQRLPSPELHHKLLLLPTLSTQSSLQTAVATPCAVSQPNCAEQHCANHNPTQLLSQQLLTAAYTTKTDRQTTLTERARATSTDEQKRKDSRQASRQAGRWTKSGSGTLGLKSRFSSGRERARELIQRGCGSQAGERQGEGE